MRDARSDLPALRLRGYTGEVAEASDPNTSTLAGIRQHEPRHGATGGDGCMHSSAIDIGRHSDTATRRHGDTATRSR